jgi:retron-type reverse transcriptase
MKRIRLDLDHVAAFDNLALAAMRAARGKHFRPDVRAFMSDLDTHLARLAEAILNGRAPAGVYRRFEIFEPKRRVIHAACFADRVLHHAVISHAGPVLERAMVPTSFACRPGKGVLVAVKHAQAAIRRYPWYVKIDIRGYFPSIDHGILLALLERRFKGAGFLALLGRIVGSHEDTPDKGLPIGALTSQYFANYYLDGLDRYLLEVLRTRDHARYMDDVLWWCDSRAEARATLAAVKSYAAETLRLAVKETAQINRSERGVTFCGYRILPGTLRLGRRRRRQYQYRRQRWEAAWLAGRIDAHKLQSAYDAVHAITLHADSRAWRQENLRRHPPVEV